MRFLFLCLLSTSITISSYSQEQMEISGAISISDSNSESPVEGTIRWNTISQDFEGYNGMEWLSLTNGVIEQPTSSPMLEKQQYTVTPTHKSAYAGYSVAIEGDWAMIGSPYDRPPSLVSGAGVVTVFKYIDGQWLQPALLETSDAEENDGFGRSIAMYGDWAVIGAVMEDVNGDLPTGKVYFFKKEGETWTEFQKIIGAIYSDKGFGAAVDIHGTWAIVGLPHRNGIGTTKEGEALIYQFTGDEWAFNMILRNTAPNSSDNMGYSVAISNSYALVGIPNHDNPNSSFGASDNTGKVVIYKNLGNIWTSAQELTIPVSQPFSNFGFDLDINEDLLAIGAPSASHTNDPLIGEVYLYQLENDIWVFSDSITLDSPIISDPFGHSVALHENYLIIGAPSRDYNNNTDTGMAFIYGRNGTEWELQEEQFDLLLDDEGKYGSDVATDGRHWIIGTPEASIPLGTPFRTGKFEIGPIPN